MADDPVIIEPVSGSPSLLTGKLTGNFVISARGRKFSRLEAAQIQRFGAQFPKTRNREFSGAYQGKISAIQGM